MDRLREILVATDFSEGGTSALVEAARLASLGPSSLHVLHVVRDEASVQLRQFLGTGSPDTAPVLRAKAEETLQAQLAELGITAASVRVEVGNPIQKIIDAIVACRADLLVVGAVGTSARAHVGTTTVRCVRKAPTKVLVVSSGAGGPYARTLACIDFSSLSEVVMMQAARIGHLDGSDVSALHCYGMPWESARWGPLPANAKEVEQRLRDVLADRFEKELLPHAHGCPVEFHVRTDTDPGRGIVQFARSKNKDLVVLGTTGRSSLAYMLLGTTAEKVLRSIGCSVLAVKRPGSTPRLDAAPGAGSSPDEAES